MKLPLAAAVHLTVYSFNTVEMAYNGMAYSGYFT